jgi:hypothetical protein
MGRFRLCLEIVGRSSVGVLMYGLIAVWRSRNIRYSADQHGFQKERWLKSVLTAGGFQGFRDSVFYLRPKVLLLLEAI